MKGRAELQRVRRAYFIGIGGIGMSALARYFRERGVDVAGYDRHRSVLTQSLEKEGMLVSYDDDARSVPEVYREKDVATLVVYTPAVGADDALMRYFREGGHALHKRSEVLGWITEGYETYAVAGTHGKTTTASMLAYALGGTVGCSAFLGGVSKNFGTNWVSGGNEGGLLVVEADEYDRSFLNLRPTLPLVTSVAPDHLDYYGTFAAVQEAFREYAKRSRSGRLVCQYGVRDYFEGLGLDLITYGVEELGAMYVAREVRYVDGRSHFTVEAPGGKSQEVTLGVVGRHNVENCLAVLAMCDYAGVSLERAASLMPDFKGVARRFSLEYIGKRYSYVDDYAHHPDEIRATLSAARDMFPGKHITAVFQPHLYSRTRDLADGFASALSGFDSVLLLPIYAAREAPLPGVSSEMIIRRMPEAVWKAMVTPSTLMDTLRGMPTEVLITLGAGDIGELSSSIARDLERWEDNDGK